MYANFIKEFCHVGDSCIYIGKPDHRKLLKLCSKFFHNFVSSVKYDQTATKIIIERPYFMGLIYLI